MAEKKSSPANTKQQAREIREAWNNIGRDNRYGNISLSDFSKAVDDLDQTELHVKNLEDQLNAARNDLAEKRGNVWDMCKRSRSGVKATHGDDSMEYERFGNVRISERNNSKSKKNDTVKPVS